MNSNVDTPQQQLRLVSTEIAKKRIYIDNARNLLTALNPTDERKTKIIANMKECEKTVKELELEAAQLRDDIAMLTVTTTTGSTSTHQINTGSTERHCITPQSADPVTSTTHDNIAASHKIGVGKRITTELGDGRAPETATSSKSQKRNAKILRTMMRFAPEKDHEQVTSRSPALLNIPASQKSEVGSEQVRTNQAMNAVEELMNTSVSEFANKVHTKPSGAHRFTVESAENVKRFIPRSTRPQPSTTPAEGVSIGSPVTTTAQAINQNVHQFSVESAASAKRFVPQNTQQLQAVTPVAKQEPTETHVFETAHDVYTNSSGGHCSIVQSAENLRTSRTAPSADVVKLGAQESLDLQIARCKEYLKQIEDRIAQCKPEDAMMAEYIKQREKTKLNLTNTLLEKSNFPRGLNLNVPPRQTKSKGSSSSFASSSVQLDPQYVLNKPLERIAFRERLMVQARERLDPNSDELKQVIEECEAKIQEAILERAGIQAELQQKVEPESIMTSTSEPSNIDASDQHVASFEEGSSRTH